MRQDGLKELSDKLDEGFDKYVKQIALDMLTSDKLIDITDQNVSKFADQFNVTLTELMRLYDDNLTTNMLGGFDQLSTNIDEIHNSDFTWTKRMEEEKAKQLQKYEEGHTKAEDNELKESQKEYGALNNLIDAYKPLTEEDQTERWRHIYDIPSYEYDVDDKTLAQYLGKNINKDFTVGMPYINNADDFANSIADESENMKNEITSSTKAVLKKLDSMISNGRVQTDIGSYITSFTGFDLLNFNNFDPSRLFRNNDIDLSNVLDSIRKVFEGEAYDGKPIQLNLKVDNSKYNNTKKEDTSVYEGAIKKKENTSGFAPSESITITIDTGSGNKTLAPSESIRDTELSLDDVITPNNKSDLSTQMPNIVKAQYEAFEALKSTITNIVNNPGSTKEDYDYIKNVLEEILNKGIIQRGSAQEQELRNLLSKQKQTADNTFDAVLKSSEYGLIQSAINTGRFGNIDLNNRQQLVWNKQTKAQYPDLAGDFEDGSISTVLGSWQNFDDYGVSIAFSPMLQTPNGPVILDDKTIKDYLRNIFKVANTPDGKIDLNKVLEIDKTGFGKAFTDKNGNVIKGLIAHATYGTKEGNYADIVSRVMHEREEGGVNQARNTFLDLLKFSPSEKATALQKIKSTQAQPTTTQSTQKKPTISGTTQIDIDKIAPLMDERILKAYKASGSIVTIDPEFEEGDGVYHSITSDITLKKADGDHIYHELGHFIDDMLNAAKNTTFQKIFEQEKNKFPGTYYMYAASNPNEYFAEAVREYVLNPDKLKKAVPNTFNYITSCLAKFTDENIEYIRKNFLENASTITQARRHYASGTRSAKGGIAEVFEKGPEIITTSKGTFVPFKGGEGVIPAKQTEALMRLASLITDGRFKVHMPDTDVFRPIDNLKGLRSETTNNIHYDSLINIEGNATQDTVDQIKEIATQLISNRQFQENVTNFVNRRQAQDGRMAGKRSIIK